MKEKARHRDHGGCLAPLTGRLSRNQDVRVHLASMLTHTRRLAKFLYSAFPSKNFFYLFVVSLFVYSVYSSAFPYTFNPDSEQYLLTAKALVGQVGQHYYYRTWGYPILMNLAGVTIFETFHLLVIIQILSSALIPALVYETTRKINERYALFISLITLISFSPAFLSNVIMTDQISMFLRCYLVYLASKYIVRPNRTLLLFIMFVGFALYLMRPADALTFVILGILLFAFMNGYRLAIAASIIAFVFSVVIYNSTRDQLSLAYAHKRGQDDTFVVGSMTGRMLFFNVYAAAPKITREPTIVATNGSCTVRLIETLVEWGESNPDGVKSYSIQGNPAIYAGVDTPEKFAAALIAEEGLFAHSVMWLALDKTVGATDADRLFFCAAIEAYISHPKSLLILYDGMVEYFFSGDVIYNHGVKEVWDHTSKFDVHIPSSTEFPERLRNELIKTDGRTTFAAKISVPLFYWINAIKIISVIIALLFLPCSFCHTKERACLIAIIAALVLYNAIISVAFAAPHYRYVFPQVPWIIMLAGIGIDSFIKLRSDRSRRDVVSR